jgi:spore maturation protein CgeB
VNLRRILLVGSTAKGALEFSYRHAADQLGISTKFFDPGIEERKYIKGGFLGRKVQTFMPLDAWIRKMNRDFVLTVREYNPDSIFLFTNARITPGALASVRAMSPDIKIVWIWPDPLLSLGRDYIVSAPLIDLVATYSAATVQVFTQLGFKKVQWVPLAGDPYMHKFTEVAEDDFTGDIVFIGSWRPERDRVMTAICRQLGNYRIEIHGNSWTRDCKDPQTRKRVLSKGVFEEAMAEKFSHSRISINVIDDTNFPAANMRFFEIPITGGLELTNNSPEMNGSFRDKEHLLYYTDEQDVVEKIKWALHHPEECRAIRKNGSTLARAEHTYVQRLETIFQALT